MRSVSILFIPFLFSYNQLWIVNCACQTNALLLIISSLYSINYNIVKLVALADQKLASQVHEIVGRINGRFGTLTAVPIHHLVRIGTFTYFVYAVSPMFFQLISPFIQLQLLLLTTLKFLKHAILCLQDRSLDFHELCALYAITGMYFVL